ncbi:MAG: hypothetical protein AB2L14_28875 [Candidatus Xenobiia bacterium LiM19]
MITNFLGSMQSLSSQGMYEKNGVGVSGSLFGNGVKSTGGIGKQDQMQKPLSLCTDDVSLSEGIDPSAQDKDKLRNASIMNAEEFSGSRSQKSGIIGSLKQLTKKICFIGGMAGLIGTSLLSGCMPIPSESSRPEPPVAERVIKQSDMASSAKTAEQPNAVNNRELSPIELKERELQIKERELELRQREVEALEAQAKIQQRQDRVRKEEEAINTVENTLSLLDFLGRAARDGADEILR